MADGLLNKASIILTPTGYKAGTLYNVAPVVEPYEDFDFARASVASRVNSSGLVEMVGRTLGSELVTNGDFATDSDWTLTQATITDGSLNLSTSDGSYTAATQTLGTIGNVYEISLDVSDIVGTISVAIGGGTDVDITTNGTHTVYITSASTTFEIKRKFGITNVSATIDNVSVKEVIDTNNIPRISYDSNGDNGHILLEPTSTNLFPYSEDFSGWTYVSPTSSITVNNAVSPDGTSNADTISYVGGGGNDYAYYNGGFTTTSASTFSVYARTTVGTKNIALRTWNTGIYETKTITTEWQRFTLSISSNLSSEKIGLDNRTTYGGSGTSGDIQVWGAQLEELSYATSYIPTLTGSQEVRATETATGAGSATLINSTEGVLYVEIAALADDGTFRNISLNNGTTSQAIRIYFRNQANKITALVGSSSGASVTVNVTDTKSFNKIAFQYKANDVKVFVNGSLGGTIPSVAMPTGLNQLDLDIANSLPFYGKVKALAVFNEALSDDELHNLTG